MSLHVTERGKQSEQDHQGDDGDHYGIDEYREVSLLVGVLGVDHYRSDKSVLGQRVEGQAGQSCVAGQSLVVDRSRRSDVLLDDRERDSLAARGDDLVLFLNRADEAEVLDERRPE